MVRQDDDFVFTISDNDEDVGLSEEEKEFERPGPASNKRKRNEDAQTSKTKSARKSKKPKITAPMEEDQDDESASDTQDWTTKGEDDGALDSDFEFQVDENTGVEEDFDGWTGGAKKSPVVQQSAASTKTAVDVDEIIERRRAAAALKADKQAKKAAQKADDFDGFGSEDDIEEIDGHIELNSEGDDETDIEDVLDGEEELDGAGSREDAEDDDNEEYDEDEDEDDQEDADSEEAKPVAHPDDLAQDSDDNEPSDEEPEDELEAERRAAFFAPESNLDGHLPPTSKPNGSFQTMNLSRPILKGLAAVGFTSPTPIQSQSIPVALLGKDVVGGAVTGSGKTGAFIIPILERLLYRPKKVPTTRVVILMPTRELAVQCFNVSKKLASFTDITFALIVGGFSVREQENTLKTRPDVLVATPGRFIDHMRNSPSFAVDTLEILVLDEADRMLEDGFADELNEILTTIPKSRQTMLFSATMTDSVDKLIRVGLNRPVRLMINAKKQTVSGLVQEFVRLRPGRETKRLACLLYLCSKVYTERCIIFFRQKKEAHRVRVIFSLCGLKAAELHGSMSQEQRISAVESFRSGTAQFLLATDLASRGLDIKNVTTVINYEAPQTHEIYLHRVGRTARAGRTGRSCTLASEPDRKIVKAAVKAARAQGAKVASRIVPVDAVDQWDEKIEGLAEEIDAVLKEEREEKALSIAERDVKRGENLVVHEAEIMSRPKRSWFESQAQKTASREAGRKELNPDSVERTVAVPKKKLSNKEKKRLALKDERKEMGNRTWKKGSDVRGKNVLVEPRDKKREKEKKAKEVAKFKKFKAKQRA